MVLKKDSVNSSMGAKANFVEQSSKKKRKCNGKGPTQGSNGSKRSKGKGYNCCKNGHRAKDYCMPMNTKKQKPQANVIEVLSDHASDLILSAIISECNLFGNKE